MTHDISINELPVQLDAAPPTDNGTVPARVTNSSVRSREYLTQGEVERLIKVARGNRFGQRDTTMILVAFRHALRVSELVALRWSDVHFNSSTLNVQRLKGSKSGSHPIEGDELRALRKLKAEGSSGEFVFQSERGAPLTAAGFRKLLSRLAQAASLGSLKVHPHMLRHATGYALANKGMDTRALQDYMGHVNIQNTAGYTQLNANRFRGIWRK
jgi:type 1 fimbriae regulatory protein FimB/type 1 fimbriae regulatory protein FimE